ncbi:hypothetical protein BDR07DRAFT_1374425 [Suillus spraguei]|nr:hypothetical protein BDR07DRAFT_1374425 [Suillus spraguei]
MSKSAMSADCSHEDRHNIQGTENNPPKDNKKPQKDSEIKSPLKQSAPASAKVSKQKKSTAKLEDQGNWSDEDTKLLLETLLGSDGQLYEKLIVNAKNGGGNPDIDEIDDKIENAWTAGKDVGTLSGVMLKKWYVEGWYSLFNEQLRKHPGLVREEEFCSGIISDAIIEIRDSNDESNRDDTSNNGFSSDKSGNKTKEET